MSAPLSRELLLEIVRERLALPLAADGGAEHLPWRSLHRARLFTAMEQATNLRPDVPALFAADTLDEVYAVYQDAAATGAAR